MPAAAGGDVPAADGVTSQRSRSRSPGVGKMPLKKGRVIQFFHAVEASDKKALLVRPKSWKSGCPQLLQSHGWLEGTLQEPFDPANFDPSTQSTWPLVVPRADIVFESRSGRPGPSTEPRRVQWIREPSPRPPLLSLVLVRWAGKYSAWMDEQEANDGDWGKYGSPPSDEYMTALVRMGVLDHPSLATADGGRHDVEIFALFVKGSMDMWSLCPSASWVAGALKGKKKAGFWMLWPAEWEDTGDPDFACYVERTSMFAAMRACEASGISSGFPHPADQFELITSKSWMATLSTHPWARLPACVLVNKEKVLNDVAAAAQDALSGMEHIRRLNPLPVQPGDPPAPSEINKDGIKKGVVKMGWSWENRFVSAFVGVNQLQARLKDMMTQSGCTASYCIVQEWVDFDFEMRQYFLPPSSCTPGARLEPVRIECNAWGERSKESTVGQSHASFSKLSEEACLHRWAEDKEAWESAKTQATEVGQFLIAWLLSANARPVPMIRLDFMVKRIGQGKARVIFGEYCEMGACCLGWKEGPPTIWKAAVDAVLR